MWGVAAADRPTDPRVFSASRMTATLATSGDSQIHYRCVGTDPPLSHEWLLINFIYA